jgi:glycosyltransferase involved in cell wall biosynthesis
VSILTPTWNRPDDLKRCIDSVLNQTFQDWEQIVYNVGDPVEVPSDPRIRYYEGERKGPAADFQACLDLASGSVVHPLSDDDRLPPHALATALEAIGESQWLIGGTVINGEQGPWAIRGGRQTYLTATSEGSYMLGGAVYWRKELSDRVGGFKTEFDGAADFDLYLRFLNDSEPALTQQVLYLYNDHAQSDSRANGARQADASQRISSRV